MDSRFLAQEQISTGADPAEFIVRLGRRVTDLMRAYPKNSYEGIGVSLPGRIDSSSHRLIFAPNLGWNDVDLKTPLEEATGLAVELENAANACALAELWSGRYGEGVSNLVVVTVSDGIGVGMVVNGQLLRGSPRGGRIRTRLAHGRRAAMSLRQLRLLGGARLPMPPPCAITPNRPPFAKGT